MLQMTEVYMAEDILNFAIDNFPVIADCQQ
jgi:hypothetical protein